MADHVHMLISIPPKHAVAQVVGYIKGKGAIHVARVYGERKRDFAGQQRKRINASPSCSFGADRPPLGGPKSVGPR